MEDISVNAFKARNLTAHDVVDAQFAAGYPRSAHRRPIFLDMEDAAKWRRQCRRSLPDALIQGISAATYCKQRARHYIDSARAYRLGELSRV